MLLSSRVCLISARVVLEDKPVPSCSFDIPMLLEETKKRQQFFTRIFYCWPTSLVEFPFFISMVRQSTLFVLGPCSGSGSLLGCWARISVTVKAEQGLIM